MFLTDPYNPAASARGDAALDPARLVAEMRALSDGSLEEKRAAATSFLRITMGEVRANEMQAFARNRNGLRYSMRLSAAHDACITALHQFACEAAGLRGANRDICLVALGGYGRNVLAPHSDIDLMFLVAKGAEARVRPLIEFTLYVLWDLGLTVGQSVRTVNEAIQFSKEDLTGRTAMLDARPVCGAFDLFSTFADKFAKTFGGARVAEFMEAKFKERDDRYAKADASRYVIEPNIKEGKGGLRDIHLLHWVVKSVYGAPALGGLFDYGVITAEENKKLRRAQRLLWTIRVHLHDIRGRADDRLTFDVQPEVAERLGYAERRGMPAVERLMQHYFLVARDVGRIVRRVTAALEDKGVKRASPARKGGVKAAGEAVRARGYALVLNGGRVDFALPDAARDGDPALLHLFLIAAEFALDVHPDAFALVTEVRRPAFTALRKNDEAQKAFVQLFDHPHEIERILRRMNEAGLLGGFIPSFARLNGRVRYSMFYRHTLDEHAIRAVGVLAQLERGKLSEDHPLASEAVGRLRRLGALYLAVLLHPLRYSGRRKDHARAGRTAAAVAKRLGFSKEERDLIEWVVANHVRFINTAEQRDLTDSKTIASLSADLRSLERLQFVLTLCVCHRRVAGPQSWDGLRRSLLRDLFFACDAYLRGGTKAALEAAFAERAAARKDEVLKLLDPVSALETTVAGEMTEDFWLAFEPEDIAAYVRAIAKARGADETISVSIRPAEGQDSTEVFIWAPDRPSLFADIAGALAVAGVSIRGARAVTMAAGQAADMFVIQSVDGEAITDKFRVEDIAARVRKAAADGLVMDPKMLPARIGARAAAFDITPDVAIDNLASDDYTVIETSGRDRPGLLYDLCMALGEAGATVHSAHIATFGVQMTDVFYVADTPASKIENERRLEVLKRRLMAVLADGSDPA